MTFLPAWPNEAVCIGCACTDHDACPDGCHWLRLDRPNSVGVCSNCPEFLPEWDGQAAGDPTPLIFDEGERQ